MVTICQLQIKYATASQVASTEVAMVTFLNCSRATAEEPWNAPPWLKPTCQSDEKTLHVVDIVAKVGPLPCENIIFSAQEMNKLMLYLYFEAECWILNDVKQNGHPLFFGIKRVTHCEALAVSQVPWGPQWGITGVLRISLGASRASCSPYCGHWPPHHFHRQGPPWHQMANHACWSAVIWSNSYFWMMWWQYL